MAILGFHPTKIHEVRNSVAAWPLPPVAKKSATKVVEATHNEPQAQHEPIRITEEEMEMTNDQQIRLNAVNCSLALPLAWGSKSADELIAAAQVIYKFMCGQSSSEGEGNENGAPRG